MIKVPPASVFIGFFIAGLIVLSCHSGRKLTKPAGSLRRSIVGKYKNYNRYLKEYNNLAYFTIEFREENGSYVGKFSIARLQAYLSDGLAKYLEGEYYNPVSSEDEIMFRSRVTTYCHAWRQGPFNKKITDWKEEEFGEPVCATPDEIEVMNRDRKNPENDGAYFRLIGDDELWLGDEDMPVRLRKVPARYTEVVE